MTMTQERAPFGRAPQNARTFGPLRRVAAGAALALALSVGSMTAAVAAPIEEPAPQDGSTMVIMVEIPARVPTATPSPNPDSGVGAGGGSSDNDSEAGGNLPSTGIYGAVSTVLLLAGGIAVLTGAALTARRRRA